ncbi:hypothetical protein MLD38_012816 [Melastoma candidum]|uniref:Uncharacterized protein n=1 Tax=Melastoma candidum TaxID=119954 RepID=A0ACB9R9C9_9MYRT|nr:hypothetical protein MLD38_012816 [Melastoma candidum]
MHHLKHNQNHPFLTPPVAHDAVPARKISVALPLIVAIPTFFLLHMYLYSPYVLSMTTTANISISHYRLSNLSITIPVRAGNTFNSLLREGDAVPLRMSPEDVIRTRSLLLPAWEILVVVEEDVVVDGGDFYCVFLNNASSMARPSMAPLSSGQRSFKCGMPLSVRRQQPFHQPALMRSLERGFPGLAEHVPELLRWNYLAYEAVSTESDVVVFMKGVNNRQGTSRSTSDLNCVFGDDPSTSIRTAVTSSVQEVFRCRHPDEAEIANLLDESGRLKVSIEIKRDKKTVPSMAYYSPWNKHSTEEGNGNSKTMRVHLCACTMVYNAAKFLKEWVTYNSNIGVDRFILYDNDSDDNLSAAIEELHASGYDVRVVPWVWQKTQEAGFSHAAVVYQDTCSWMMYMDVDEFVYSPAWDESPEPSPRMLKSLIPKNSPGGPKYGQVSIKCYEFGPSDHHSHPPEGVTQGYTCRMKADQRHKSIVMLNAVDPSLVNVVHHFELREGYRSKQAGLEKAVVNHYKYQAWPEFKTKFRRRVSAYVVDWTQGINLGSKDRAPGLGNEAVEPVGWAQKFCEVRDLGLKEMTARWSGRRSTAAIRLI